MTRPVMFLRTAQTESRIEELEKKMEQVMERLGMMEPPRVSISDEEWEAAAKPMPIEWKEPDPVIPPKQSKIAQKVAKR